MFAVVVEFKIKGRQNPHGAEALFDLVETNGRQTILLPDDLSIFAILKRKAPPFFNVKLKIQR